MIESQFTSNIHKKLAPDVYKWKIADQFAAGVPDAFYRVVDKPLASHLWVEYKFIKSLPKRAATRIIPNLSATQLRWLEMATAAGELATVVVGVEDEVVNRQVCGFFMSQQEWTEGITASEAKSRLMPYAEIAQVLRVLMVDGAIPATGYRRTADIAC